MFSAVKGYFLGRRSPTESTEEEQSQEAERKEQQDQPPMQGQKRDLERPEMEDKKRARVFEKAAASDAQETSSVRERSSMDSRRRDLMRARAYSASAQDITSTKPYIPTETRAADTNQLDGRRKEITRGRSNSVARREVRPFEIAHIVDDRSVERPRKRRDVSTTRDRQIQDLANPSNPLTPTVQQFDNAANTPETQKDPEKKEPVQVAADDRIVERARKRRDTSVARDRQFQDLLNHNNSLKIQLDKTLESLKEAEKKKIELYNTNNVLQDEKARLLGRESATRRDATTKDREAKQKIVEWQERNHRQEEEIRILKERLRYAEEKNMQMSNLLQVRTADLRGAETFLTTADQYSGFDITTMVDTLNAEIFQAAAFMAELLEDPGMVATEDERKKNMTKYVHGLENAHQQIGNGLFGYFLEKGASVRADPLPLQLALQTLFARWCAFMIHRFSGGGLNSEMTRLYERIQGSEAQAVAGRWRAITFTNLKAVETQTFSDQILDMALGLLFMCGWSVNSPRSQKAILSMQQMVGAIERLWIHLKSATKEGITTSDMEVFIIDFGKSYDEGAMEDNYSDAPSRSSTKAVAGARKGHVLCTVGMGLRRSVVKRTESEPERQVDILMKPKVALSTVLEDVEVGGAVEVVLERFKSPSRMDGRG